MVLNPFTIYIFQHRIPNLSREVSDDLRVAEYTLAQASTIINTTLQCERDLHAGRRQSLTARLNHVEGRLNPVVEPISFAGRCKRPPIDVILVLCCDSFLAIEEALRLRVFARLEFASSEGRSFKTARATS
jgi:hypothetical protein